MASDNDSIMQRIQALLRSKYFRSMPIMIATELSWPVR
jgi:hypothetical protein